MLEEGMRPAVETETEPSGSGAPSVDTLPWDDEEEEYTAEEYQAMLEQYDKTMHRIEQGNIVPGRVMAITDTHVIVDIGFKSEGVINRAEFGQETDVQVDDDVEVFLEDVEDQEGRILLSKQKADFMRVWDRIKHAYDSGEIVEGRAVRRIKGGLLVDLFGVEAFLPGSQIDIRQVQNFEQFITDAFPLRIIKLNKNRRNIVVSRRVLLEEERDRMRKKILSELEKDQIREGVVKNLTDFGAFIDLGGVDGLLHISDISWGRVNHPSEALNVGETIRVKVLNYDEERGRISLGYKHLTPYPWENIEQKYPVDSRVTGRVVSITDYGAFVELEEGVEGLIHVSEMSWTQHIRRPSQVVSAGDEIDVMVLRVDAENEKISLGMKQLEPDPWETLDQRYPVGTRITGKVRNLTNFGAFVEIEGGIDGLVHISDMSWTRRIRHPSEAMKKGEDVEVVVLHIDASNRRISLGHKQVLEDPWDYLAEKYQPGYETEGEIVRVLDRGVVVDLEKEVAGFVPGSQLGQLSLRKPAEGFKEGDILPLEVVECNRPQRKIVLSAREYFRDRPKEELEEYRQMHQPGMGQEALETPEAPETPESGEVEGGSEEQA
jgi:small subunit ribosomal protein S1